MKFYVRKRQNSGVAWAVFVFSITIISYSGHVAFQIWPFFLSELIWNLNLKTVNIALSFVKEIIVAVFEDYLFIFLIIQFFYTPHGTFFTGDSTIKFLKYWSALTFCFILNRKT